MSNGRGGGSATFAQGGSSEFDKIDDVIKTIKEYIKENI